MTSTASSNRTLTRRPGAARSANLDEVTCPHDMCMTLELPVFSPSNLLSSAVASLKIRATATSHWCSAILGIYVRRTKTTKENDEKKSRHPAVIIDLKGFGSRPELLINQFLAKTYPTCLHRNGLAGVQAWGVSMPSAPFIISVINFWPFQFF